MPDPPLQQTEGKLLERLQRAEQWAASIDSHALAARELEQLITTVVEKHAAWPVTVHFDRRYVTDPPPVFDGQSGQATVSLQVTYPITGSANIMMDIDPPRCVSSLSTRANEAETSFDLQMHEGQELTAEILQMGLNHLEVGLTNDASRANRRIEEHRREMTDLVRRVLTPRWTATRTVRGVLTELNIPLEPVTGPTSFINLHPRELTLSATEARVAGGETEWTLADDLADGVVATIVGFSRALERLTATANKLLEHDEEGVRDILLFALNANYRGAITGETFSNRGKSDLLLRWNDRDAFIAECKVYNGPQHLLAGVTQLLTRYALWRHSRLALILIIRGRKSPTSVIESAVGAIRDHPLVVSAASPGEVGDPHTFSGSWYLRWGEGHAGLS